MLKLFSHQSPDDGKVWEAGMGDTEPRGPLTYITGRSLISVLLQYDDHRVEGDLPGEL